MVRFNTDITFIDTSGQVVSRSGDLTLRANANGDGYIIVGSGRGLVPDKDCSLDLGTDWLRWDTLNACSGNFRDRISINGSGVALVDELENVISLSGISKLVLAETIGFQSSTSTSFIQVVTVPFSVPVEGTYRAQWSFEGSASAANKSCVYRIQLDDSALVGDLMNINTSFNVPNGALQFGGFAQFHVAAGNHSVDFDMRFAETGTVSVQVQRLRLEILKIS